MFTCQWLLVHEPVTTTARGRNRCVHMRRSLPPGGSPVWLQTSTSLKHEEPHHPSTVNHRTVSCRESVSIQVNGCIRWHRKAGLVRTHFGTTRIICNPAGIGIENASPQKGWDVDSTFSYQKTCWCMHFFSKGIRKTTPIAYIARMYLDNIWRRLIPLKDSVARL